MPIGLNDVQIVRFKIVVPGLFWEIILKLIDLKEIVKNSW